MACAPGGTCRRSARRGEARNRSRARHRKGSPARIATFSTPAAFEPVVTLASREGSCRPPRQFSRSQPCHPPEPRPTAVVAGGAVACLATATPAGERHMRASTILMSLPLAFASLAPLHAQEVLTGEAAFGTWEPDAPGIRRHITPADLPPPSHAENDPEAPDFENMATVVPAPEGATPEVPEGFAVEVFAEGLNQPRVIRIAPNGDSSWPKAEPGASSSSPPMRPPARRPSPRSSPRASTGPSASPSIRRASRNTSMWRRPTRSSAIPTAPATAGERRGRGHHPGHPDRAALDARPRGLARRGASLRLDRIGFQRRRRNAGEDAGRDRGLSKRRTGSAPPGATRRTAPWCASSTPTARTSGTTRPACATAPA